MKGQHSVNVTLVYEDAAFLSDLAKHSSITESAMLEAIVRSLRQFVEDIPENVLPKDLMKTLSDYLKEGTMEEAILGTLESCKDNFIREAVSEYFDDPPDPPDYYSDR